MVSFPRSVGRPGSNAVVLAGLLVCTLVLATLLAYEAHDATRSHRATAERALHDYAAVAAWEAVAGISDHVQTAIGNALAPVTRTRATSPYELLPAPAVLASTADSVLRCAADDAVARTYFRLDFRNGSLATAGAVPSAVVSAWLADSIPPRARAVYQPEWSYAVSLAAPRGEVPFAVVYGVKYAEHAAPIAAYGFITCQSVVARDVAADVMAHRALLPASATGGVSNDSLVGITVSTASGQIVYQSERGSPSSYAADATLAQVGPLKVHAEIRARAVELLALGAIPKGRVPWLVGLLILTAAMVGVTVTQLRREQQLARLRADFISSVSHELRTPLSQILLFAETLNLGRVRTDQERVAATDVIVQEGRRLMHLVENILHFSRTERRMTRLVREPLDLSDAVAAIVDDWRPLAAASDMRVDTRLAPNAVVMADRGALRQMVLNLLDNAVKYGDGGQTIAIGTAVSDTGARVWVDDQGNGIPAADRQRVFESFYRLDRHANSSIAGSGIGLYVVRELARLHGGDAWVEDAPTGGARIVIELPCAARPAPIDDAAPAATMDLSAELNA